jgi:hypothetical protein
MNNTPIDWPLRAWFVVEVGFGIAAILAVGLAPHDTQNNFAWPIQPVVMAAVLGAFYSASAPLFVLPLLAHRWEVVRAMTLPIALFATAQLVATFLHWDKFTVGSFPFYVWFASYLLPPPIFVAAYIWHQRKSTGSIAPADDPLPGWLTRALWFGGLALTAGAVLVFLFPQLLIPYFPWKLTALTARSLCGWLMAVGALMLAVRLENSRSRARLITPMFILLPPLLLVQMLRYSDQVNWNNAVLWSGLGLLTLIGLAGLYLAWGSWRKVLQ